MINDTMKDARVKKRAVIFIALPLFFGRKAIIINPAMGRPSIVVSKNELKLYYLKQIWQHKS